MVHKGAPKCKMPCISRRSWLLARRWGMVRIMAHPAHLLQHGSWESSQSFCLRTGLGYCVLGCWGLWFWILKLVNFRVFVGLKFLQDPPADNGTAVAMATETSKPDLEAKPVAKDCFSGLQRAPRKGFDLSIVLPPCSKPFLSLHFGV